MIIYIGLLSTDGGVAGPQRTRRSNHRKAQNPYPRQGEENGDQPAAVHRRALLRLPRARSPCPRGGFPFCYAAAARSEDVWDPSPLDAPQHASQVIVARFLGMLTANLSESALLTCAEQVQHGVRSLAGDQRIKSVCDVVEQCAAAFSSNDVSSFMIMTRLIQLKSTITRRVQFCFPCCISSSSIEL